MLEIITHIKFLVSAPFDLNNRRPFKPNILLLLVWKLRLIRSPHKSCKPCTTVRYVYYNISCIVFRLYKTYKKKISWTFRIENLWDIYLYRWLCKKTCTLYYTALDTTFIFLFFGKTRGINEVSQRAWLATLCKCM